MPADIRYAVLITPQELDDAQKAIARANIGAGTGGGGGPVDLNNAALTGATTAEQISPVPAPMGALAIDVTKALNTKSVAANSTLTFSGTPAVGAVFGVFLTADATDRTITIPSSYSVAQNLAITSFVLPASSSAYLTWRYTGSAYHLFGEPLPPERAVTNAQAASYTLVLSDEGKIVEVSNGSANNLTVPLNATVAYAVGAQIVIRQGGAGQTTVVATGGVTINSRGGALKLAGQYSTAVLTKKATDTWNLDGDIST